MRLTELDPQFLGPPDSAGVSQHMNCVAGCAGIRFVCPKCFEANGCSDIGVHSFICWRPIVALSVLPGPGRWEFTGTDYDDLSLVAGSSSIAAIGDGCRAHFYIRNGDVIPAGANWS